MPTNNPRTTAATRLRLSTEVLYGMHGELLGILALLENSDSDVHLDHAWRMFERTMESIADELKAFADGADRLKALAPDHHYAAGLGVSVTEVKVKGNASREEVRTILEEKIGKLGAGVMVSVESGKPFRVEGKPTAEQIDAILDEVFSRRNADGSCDCDRCRMARELRQIIEAANEKARARAANEVDDPATAEAEFAELDAIGRELGSSQPMAPRSLPPFLRSAMLETSRKVLAERNRKRAEAELLALAPDGRMQPTGWAEVERSAQQSEAPSARMIDDPRLGLPPRIVRALLVAGHQLVVDVRVLDTMNGLEALGLTPDDREHLVLAGVLPSTTDPLEIDLTNPGDLQAARAAASINPDADLTPPPDAELPNEPTDVPAGELVADDGPRVRRIEVGDAVKLDDNTDDGEPR